MSYHYFEQVIDDIDQYPEQFEILMMHAFTIGDLHACFPKWLHLLTKFNIIALDRACYDALITIYRQPVLHLTDQDLNIFREHIQKIELKRPNVVIRLLGDEVADRGMNDYYNLVFLDHLISEQKRNTGTINVRIIFSNHGAEFIHAYEHFEINQSLYNHHVCMDNQYDLMRSMFSLSDLIQSPHNSLSWNDVKILIGRAYQPCIYLVDYEYDVEEKTIHLYSHAPVDMRAYSTVAKLLNCAYDELTIESFLKSLDAINQAFNAIINANALHLYYSIHHLRPTVFSPPHYLEKYIYDHPKIETILGAIVWNRYAALDRQLHPFHEHTLKYIHGHTHTEPGPDSGSTVFNLDDYCGKVPHDEWEWHKNKIAKCFVSWPLNFVLSFDSLDCESVPSDSSPDTPGLRPPMHPNTGTAYRFFHESVEPEPHQEVFHIPEVDSFDSIFCDPFAPVDFL